MTKDASEWQPPFGQYLGGMTDELEKDYGIGAYATHFIAAGPKTYSLMVEGPTKELTEAWKVKGFPRCTSLERAMQFEKLRAQIQAFIKDRNNLIVVPVEFLQIRRTKHHHVLTAFSTKDLSVTYDKRLVLEDGSTLPRGY